MFSAHLVGGDRFLGMHVAVMIVMVRAPVGRYLRRAVVRVFDITHFATLEQPLLPLSRRAGATLVQFRAPLALEIRYLR